MFNVHNKEVDTTMCSIVFDTAQPIANEDN